MTSYTAAIGIAPDVVPGDFCTVSVIITDDSEPVARLTSETALGDIELGVRADDPVRLAKAPHMAESVLAAHGWRLAGQWLISADAMYATVERRPDYDDNDGSLDCLPPREHDLRAPGRVIPDESTRFTLDEEGLEAVLPGMPDLGSFTERYPVDSDHSAVLALTTAIAGNDEHSRPLITGPCEMAVELLANEDGELDGFRVLICPGGPWLGGDIERVADLDLLNEPTEDGGLYDTAEIIRDAVRSANLLLDWYEDTLGTGSTAAWFTEARAMGCTATGFSARNDTLIHDGAPPCPLHEPVTFIPQPPGPRYTAHFAPEAWAGGYAIPVDAPVPQSWDCTAFAREKAAYLKRLEAHSESLDGPDGAVDNDDVFQADPAAPAWVRAWTGPFTIRIRRDRQSSGQPEN